LAAGSVPWSINVPARPKLPQLKSSKLLIRLADWKIVAVRYWLHFDGDIEE
jgi:hypothetical protein